MYMSISHRIIRPDIVLFVIQGKWSAGGFPIRTYIDPFLEKDEIRGIIINCFKVSLIDSAGIGFLFTMMKYLDLNDGKLALCGLNRELQKTLYLTGLEKKMIIFDEEQEAVDALLQILG